MNKTSANVWMDVWMDGCQCVFGGTYIRILYACLHDLKGDNTFDIEDQNVTSRMKRSVPSHEKSSRNISKFGLNLDQIEGKHGVKYILIPTAT